MHATADRAAERAKGPATVRPGSGILQRKCACGGTTGPTGECAECRKKRLQRRALAGAAGPSVAPPIVHDVLRSPGRPLDDGVRSEMEPRFGHSFADVRVHADGRADESARAVEAAAYTVGRDVVFAAGRYAPASDAGRRLIAHELAHVVQQRGAASASLQPRLEIGTVDDPAEREADAAAGAVMRGGAGGVRPRSGPRLSRQVDENCGCINGKWKWCYDGCSRPEGAPEWVDAFRNNPAGGEDTLFSNDARTGPCDEHDRCYQTCNPTLSARAACDLKMFEDMAAVCARAKPARQAICMSFALAYYTGLVKFGLEAFIERQAQVCACTLQGATKDKAGAPRPPEGTADTGTTTPIQPAKPIQPANAPKAKPKPKGIPVPILP